MILKDMVFDINTEDVITQETITVFFNVSLFPFKTDCCNTTCSEFF